MILRYACLNSEGVRNAMVLPPNASNMDVEKRDKNMAKVVIDTVGLEPEKYRLGYTKVVSHRCHSVSLGRLLDVKYVKAYPWHRCKR